MRSSGLLSVVPLSAILLLCPAGANAQTSAAPSAQPAPLKNPLPFVAPVPPPLFGTQTAPQLPSPSTTFPVPPLLTRPIPNHQPLEIINSVHAMDPQQQAALLARNRPCYTLRTYGFTAGHDPAEAPRLSSSTTCTPASGTHARELVKTPSIH